MPNDHKVAIAPLGITLSYTTEVNKPVISINTLLSKAANIAAR